MLTLSFLTTHWRALTFGFAMCLLSSFGQTFFISLFGGQLKGTFSISDGEFGTIYSMATLASAAVIIWSGRLVDRLSLRKMATIVLAGLSVMCALMWLGHFRSATVRPGSGEPYRHHIDGEALRQGTRTGDFRGHARPQRR